MNASARLPTTWNTASIKMSQASPHYTSEQTVLKARLFAVLFQVHDMGEMANIFFKAPIITQGHGHLYSKILAGNKATKRQTRLYADQSKRPAWQHVGDGKDPGDMGHLRQTTFYRNGLLENRRLSRWKFQRGVASWTGYLGLDCSSAY
jgi:hypothetical protein